jgi:hypothetical protein
MISSRSQWQYVSNGSDTHELLRSAYGNGLVIGTIYDEGIALG